MHIAERLSRVKPYLFAELRRKIAQAREAGIDVISLAIGDPVEPTPAPVIEELCAAAREPANHRYPTGEERGMLAFRQAVARWYKKHYDVELDPESEIVALIGSKEGVHHFCLAAVNPGDTVLVTDPGYPAYNAGILLAGGTPHPVPILAENNYLPDLSAIPTDVARQATAFFLNYPNNPTGATATDEFFHDLVQFGKDFDIAICHDNPYSLIVFGTERPRSFLQAEGAREIGVELNSLSKPYNMTGWRIGLAAGNPELVAAIAKVKQNTDSGIFNPIQFAGIKALEECEENITRMRDIYARRQKLVLDKLKEVGIDFELPKGTFYLWLPTPAGMSSIDFATMLFEKAHVVVGAGSAYGNYGEGYVRFSLTVPDDRLQEALRRMKEAFP